MGKILLGVIVEVIPDKNSTLLRYRDESGKVLVEKLISGVRYGDSIEIPFYGDVDVSSQLHCVLGAAIGSTCMYYNRGGYCDRHWIKAKIENEKPVCSEFASKRWAEEEAGEDKKEIGEITFKLNIDCSEALKQLDEVKERMKRLSRDPTVNRMVDRLTEDDIRGGLIIHPLTGLKHDKDLEAKPL